MHEENIDIVKREIPERDFQRRGHVAVVVPPVLGDNGDLGARDPALADGTANDRLYAVVLGCVDNSVAVLQSVDYGFLEGRLILGPKPTWYVADE